MRSKIQLPISLPHKTPLPSSLPLQQTNKQTLNLKPKNPTTNHAQKHFSFFPQPKRPGLSLAFFKPIHVFAPPSSSNRQTKISVIGSRNVDMAIVETFLTQDLADELVLVDAIPDKLRSEILDLQHAAAFLPCTKINASVDYAITAGFDLCIVTSDAVLGIRIRIASRNRPSPEIRLGPHTRDGDAFGLRRI